MTKKTTCRDRRRHTVGSLLAFIVAASCASPSSPPVTPPRPLPKPVDVRGIDSVRAEIKELGGIMRLENGAVLRFGTKAVVGSVNVFFSEAPDNLALRATDEQRPLGPMLRIEPQAEFAENNRPSLAIRADVLPEGFEEGDLALAMEFAEQRSFSLGSQTPTIWRFFPARKEEGWLIADLEQFSGLRVHFVVRK